MISPINGATRGRIGGLPGGPGAVAAALLLLIFLPLGQWRLIDGDEGYYLLAAAETARGRLPYRDFFFTQTPMLPLAGAVWYRVTEGAFGGMTWNSGRILASLLAAAAGLLLFRSARRDGPVRAVATLFLFAASGLVLAWFPVFKTYALSAALLLVACEAVRDDPDASPYPPFARVIIGGVFLGLAVSTRLYLVLLFPMFYRQAGRRIPDRTQRSMLRVAMLAAFCAGLIPCLMTFSAEPRAWWFGNVGYHLTRSGASAADQVMQKFEALGELFDLASVRGAAAAQVIMILGLAVSGGRASWRFETKVALALCVISLIPSPAFAQYFCLAVPFACPAAGRALAELFASHGMSAGRARLRRRAATGLVLAYLLCGGAEVVRHTWWGAGVPGVGEHRRTGNYRLSTMREIGRVVRSVTEEDDRVLTWWPGYIVASGRPHFAGTENHFGQLVDEAALGPFDRVRFRIMPPWMTEEVIAARTPRAIVIGIWTGDWRSSRKGHFIERITEAGYTETARVGDAIIYVRDDDYDAE